MLLACEIIPFYKFRHLLNAKKGLEQTRTAVPNISKTNHNTGSLYSIQFEGPILLLPSVPLLPFIAICPIRTYLIITFTVANGADPEHNALTVAMQVSSVAKGTAHERQPTQSTQKDARACELH